jgi:hypothetical protein
MQSTASDEEDPRSYYQVIGAAQWQNGRESAFDEIARLA